MRLGNGCRVEPDWLGFRLGVCGGEMILLGGRDKRGQHDARGWRDMVLQAGCRALAAADFRLDGQGGDMVLLGGWIVRRGREKRGQVHSRGRSYMVLGAGFGLDEGRSASTQDRVDVLGIRLNGGGHDVILQRG